MNKSTFKTLFLKVASDAIEQAQAAISKEIPFDFVVEMHGGKGSTGQGRLMTIDEAIDAMFIDEEYFYVVIDVLVKTVIGNRTILFVRPSGHEPTRLGETYNTPKDYSPFKVMLPADLKIFP
jgi:hypothetical protein